MSKQSFEIEPIDCRMLKKIVDDFNNCKTHVQRAIANMNAAKADYDEYITRTAKNVGLDIPVDQLLKEYRINFATMQIEPIPDPVTVKPIPPTTAPDANEPPAPGRDLEVDLSSLKTI